MTASFRSSSIAGAVLGGDPVLSVPAGVQNGDLLIIYGACGGGGVVSTPAGWTYHANSISTQGPLFWRIASSEPASYTIVVSSTVSSGFVMVAFRDVDQSNPLQVVANTNGTGALVLPTVTAANANSVLASLVMKLGSSSWTGPGSMPERFDTAAPSSGYTGAEGDEVVAAGATGTRTWTPVGAAGGIGYNVIINPVPAKQGTGALTFDITETGTGKRVPKGTGASTFDITETGTGKRVPKGVGASTFDITMASTGKRVPKGVGAATYDLLVAGTGKRVPKGVATSTLDLTMVGVGGRASLGAGALTFDLALAGTGKFVPSGIGALSYELALAATGMRVTGGTGALTLTLGVAATGKREPKGAAVLAFGLTISATGSKVRPRNMEISAASLHGNRLIGHSRLTPLDGEDLSGRAVSGSLQTRRITGRLEQS